MLRRPPRSTQGRSSAASDVYKRQGLYVLRNSTVPAILVEMGYVNHGSDAKLLSDTGFQGQTASAIVDAVIRYLGGPASSKAEGPG